MLTVTMSTTLILTVLLQHFAEISGASCTQNTVYVYETKLSSPNPYTNYFHECFILESEDGTSKIEINMDIFSLDDSGDVINIYDGGNVSAVQLRDYTGRTNNSEISIPGPYAEFPGSVPVPAYFAWLVAISSGPKMLVDFITDGSDTRTGYTISLNLRPSSCTDLSANHAAKSLLSPNAPGVYDANANWCWKITSVLSNRRVILTVVTLSIGSDVIRVKSGESPVNLLLEYWTGTVASGTMTTSRHASVNIIFCVRTPDSPSNGFEISYVTAPPCNHNPCPGRKCRDLSGQTPDVECYCDPGRTGLRCQTDIDECLSNPCGTGGECEDEVNGYTCSCAMGYSGWHCEPDSLQCLSRPCVNGGTCTNLVNAFTCNCPPSWQGTTCDQDYDECSSNPCLNGGVCNNLSGRFTCDCPPGWQGTRCDRDAAVCISEPCMNGGTCWAYEGKYECWCPEEFVGINCEIELAVCVGGGLWNAQSPACTNLFHDAPCSVCSMDYVMDFCDDVTSENLFRRLSSGMDLNQTWYSYGLMDTNDMIKKANVEVSHRSKCPLLCMGESNCLGYVTSNSSVGANVCKFTLE